MVDEGEESRGSQEELELERERIEIERQRLALEREQEEREERLAKKPKESGLMGGLATGAVGKGGGTLFLILVFIIYLLDLWPGFGGRYTGFQWLWGNFDNIDIYINVFLSSIFGLFFLYYLVNRVIRGDWEKFGYETFSFGLFAFVITFFILNNQWFASPKAIIHFLFIIVFGLTFIKSWEESSSTYIYIVVLLLLDFFGYRLLENIFVFRYIPLLFFFTVIYIYQKTRSRASIFFFVAVLIILFIFAYKDVQAQGDGFDFIAEDAGLSFGDIWTDAKLGIEGIFTSAQISLQKQIQYAITGKVEENQFEPLGVYLEGVQSADPRYYEDEDVIVWGSIKARTLDDPINIKVGCYVKDGDEKILAERPYGKTDPDKKFSVFAFEEQDFACTFDKCCTSGPCTDEQRSECKLKSGSGTITTFADFNFETLAYRKVYFINRERQRAMVREGLDIFEEFDIKDKDPVAIYTNGPAAIEMGTTTPLVGVSDDSTRPTSLSLSLKNREGWQGKINQLKELVLFLPQGVELVKDDNENFMCGNKEFTIYDEDKCKTESCKEFVYDECAEVCSDSNAPPPAYTNGKYSTTSGNKCIKDCIENANKCVDVCESLFSEGDQKYNAYALAKDEIRVLKDKDFEKGKSFRCVIKPAIGVLGNTPITTKFFRVKVRYNYTVEESVTVSIDKLPDEPEPSEDTSVAPPTNLIVSKVAVVSINKLILKWELSADDGEGQEDVKGYNIYRKKSRWGLYINNARSSTT